MDGITGTRRAFAFSIVMILLAGFGFRVADTALAARPDVLTLGGGVAVAAPDEVVTPLRLAWLGGCYPPAMAVGAYAPADAPCHPSGTISLDQLQAELSARGALTPGESLDYAPQPRARRLICWGLIMNGDRAAGWACSDESGVYRTSMNGQASSERWQLQSDGSWVKVAD